METIIPSMSEVRSQLKRLRESQLKTLAATSGVPFPTLVKIRYGVTENPGIETVRKFMPYIEACVGGK